MKEYVCGFCFSSDFKHVALIRKNRPEWQSGLLNGIGGKVEQDELPVDAMRREFEEETGLRLPVWSLVCTHDWNTKVRVSFYVAIGNLAKLRTMTDEEVVVVPVDAITSGTISNIPWLVPMALETLTRGCSYSVREN